MGDIAEDLGPNLSEYHIFNLFRCVLSFSATLEKHWKVQFRLGFAKNSTMLIQITTYKYEILLCFIYSWRGFANED